MPTSATNCIERTGPGLFDAMVPSAGKLSEIEAGAISNPGVFLKRKTPAWKSIQTGVKFYNVG
jgi:hypothetical protein